MKLHVWIERMVVSIVVGAIVAALYMAWWCACLDFERYVQAFVAFSVAIFVGEALKEAVGRRTARGGSPRRP